MQWLSAGVVNFCRWDWRRIWAIRRCPRGHAGAQHLIYVRLKPIEAQSRRTSHGNARNDAPASVAFRGVNNVGTQVYNARRRIPLEGQLCASIANRTAGRCHLEAAWRLFRTDRPVPLRSRWRPYIYRSHISRLDKLRRSPAAGPGHGFRISAGFRGICENRRTAGPLGARCGRPVAEKPARPRRRALLPERADQ